MEDGNAADGRNVLTFSSTSTHDHDGDGGTTDVVEIQPVMLTITEDDNDGVGVTVSEKTLTVREGDTTGKDYTVVLGSAPSHAVTVSVTVESKVNANIMADMPSLTFTPLDWDTKQTVKVTAGPDSNALNGSAKITHKASSIDADYNGIKIADVSVKEIDSVRTITLKTSADSVDEGEDITITATLEALGDDTPPSLSSPVTVKLSRKSGSKDYSVPDIEIGAGSTSKSVVFMATHDADADNEKVTLTASVDSTSGLFNIPENEITIQIMDDDVYMLTADKKEVAEGEKVTLTVKVTPKAEVETKVMIDLYRASGATVMPAADQDADDDGNAIIDVGEDSAEFTLTTAKDANDANDEVIVARAMVDTSVVGSPVEIMVLDTQASPEYMLSVDPTAIGETDGEASVMVKVMTNKAVAADTTLTLAVDASSTATAMDDYSIMPEMMKVMIEKGEDMGMVELMVTPVADAMDEANETIVLTAWMDDDQVGNAATLTIIDGDSTTFTLSGPSDMNLVEGFEYDIEVMASTAVKADTTVMIMRSDASTAGDADYSVENITIMAGETMGRTKLMVKSDDMPDGGTDGGMAEKLVLYGMVGNMRTNELSFYLWDLAVPALPVIAQLLLAGLMAVGGYRRYRRR